MNKFYKFPLTISSTLWFLAIWVVWYIFNLPKCESFKFEISIVNAGEKFPDFAGLKFPLSGKKIY